MEGSFGDGVGRTPTRGPLGRAEAGRRLRAGCASTTAPSSGGSRMGVAPPLAAATHRLRRISVGAIRRAGSSGRPVRPLRWNGRPRHQRAHL